MRKWRFKDEEMSPYEKRLRHWIEWLEMQPQDKFYSEVLFLIGVEKKVRRSTPKIKTLLKIAKKELNTL